MLPTTEVTCGRKTPSSLMDSGLKKRRRRTSATSSLLTGLASSSIWRPKTWDTSRRSSFPKSSCFLGSEASSEATMAQRSTFTTACVRYWKKLINRPRQLGSFSTCMRIYINTSSRRTKVERPSSCGLDSRSTMSGSAGGVSRSSSLPSAWMSLRPSAPAN